MNWSRESRHSHPASSSSNATVSAPVPTPVLPRRRPQRKLRPDQDSPSGESHRSLTQEGVKRGSDSSNRYGGGRPGGRYRLSAPSPPDLSSGLKASSTPAPTEQVTCQPSSQLTARARRSAYARAIAQPQPLPPSGLGRGAGLGGYRAARGPPALGLVAVVPRWVGFSASSSVAGGVLSAACKRHRHDA